MEQSPKPLVFDLVRALGGPARVSRACGVTLTAVSNWSVRNEIPARHWIVLWRMALAAGLDWCPPGAEDLTIVPRASRMGGDPVSPSMFAQCSRHAPQQAPEAA